MRKLRFIAAAAVALLAAVPAGAADLVGAVEKGNLAFRQQDYKQALEQYQVAETERPESPEIDYNIAGVLHQEGKFEEAVERYTKALNSEDMAVTAGARFNLGNTYYKMGDYQNAITQYEEALKLNPSDMDAKFNLELARKMLKENMKPQEQQQDQQQQQQQQKEQQQQQQEEDKKEQPQPKEDEKQKDQQQEQKQSQQVKEQDVSKEDAERILNALRDDEQDVQKKVKRQVVAGEYNGKDW